ncbi:PASTA domain-containing protein [candidate division KSB1 bacterium]|nr:PASTA domain-containing protein [candidate division KSB1 bacterium]
MSTVSVIRRILGWPIVRYPLIIFVGMIILYFIFDIVIMPIYTRHGQAIEVPNVTEMTFEGARTLLDQQDLKIVEKAKKFDINFRSGTVISQHPEPGSQVKKGRRIYVIVSKGEPTVEMPRVVGKSEKNATFELLQLGLKVRHVTYEFSSHFPADVVFDQSVPDGDEIKVGDGVDLSVSYGQFPDRFVVPEVVGRSLKDAQKVIEQAGLTIGMVTYRMEPELLPETVVEQSILANSEVNQGEALHLVVSKLPENTEETEQ